MSKCLGGRVVKLTSKKNWDIEATILVESKNDDIFIRLCTGLNTYSCCISITDVSEVFGGRKETFATITDSDRMIEFGRHCLRNDCLPEKSQNQIQSGTKFDNIHISFEYSKIIKGAEDDDGENVILVEDVNFIIREKLQYGMMKIILHSTMKKIVGRLSYCIAVGEALNQSISKVEELESQKSMWKKTAEDLDRTQQENKDTLLSNFTTLRNFMIEKHKKELKDLINSHDEEKKSWDKEFSAKVVATQEKSRPKRRNNDDKQYDDLLKDRSHVDCLAEGRKIATTKSRNAIIDQPIDFADIKRQEQAYHIRKTKPNEERKRKKIQHGENDDDDDDDDDSTVSGDSYSKNKRKKFQQTRLVPKNDNDDDESVNSDDDYDIKKSKTTKKFTARRNEDQDSVSSSSYNDKKSYEYSKKNKSKKTRQQHLFVEEDSGEDSSTASRWTLCQGTNNEKKSDSKETNAKVPAIMDDASVSSDTSWLLGK